ncbi:MAG: aminodeoxychorismate synthase component I [Rudaea sp.]|uniref:aminodeoxychorismate synthase component I n=1 Tax=Rudaea sp. TaxID=2136325 RepID=UPI0039E57794
MNCVRRELPGARDLLALAARRPARYPGLLESAAQGGSAARFDMLFATDGTGLVLDGDGRVRDLRGADRGDSFLAALDADWRSSSAGCADAQLPFRGGWLVYLGYELAGEIEPRLRSCLASCALTPAALALRCPVAAVVDRLAQKTWLVAEAGQEHWLDVLTADLAEPAGTAAAALPQARIEEDDPQRFLDGVARIHEYLRAGDTFQVNLSREWRVRFDRAPTPASVYVSLRRANPAPFAGLLQWGDWAVVSSSPERLLEIRGGLAQTRPIAGTRPRRTGEDDAVRIAELVGHAKERAEHVMLLDLERNDLGRICAPGSVAVDELMTVESYAHVHHIVSNVRGRLRAGITPAQAIRAVFPGGTITGAPKVRTMEIIAELEACARGAYTGALGYLNRDGDMDLNILIRTMELRGREARFRAGAGIVADSVAARELEETRHKARGLLRALDAAE